MTSTKFNAKRISMEGALEATTYLASHSMISSFANPSFRCRPISLPGPIASCLETSLVTIGRGRSSPILEKANGLLCLSTVLNF